MIPEFNKLTDEEVELMMKAPLLTSILIAGADNDIDKKEIKKAIEIGQLKQRRSKALLTNYYQVVGEDFEDKLKILIQSFPFESTQRNPLIIQELSALNRIFPKLDKAFATEFYNNLREIAQKIAESSGGVLGLKSIGDEEAKLISLPMIQNPSLH